MEQNMIGKIEDFPIHFIRSFLEYGPIAVPSVLFLRNVLSTRKLRSWVYRSFSVSFCLGICILRNQ